MLSQLVCSSTGPRSCLSWLTCCHSLTAATRGAARAMVVGRARGRDRSSRPCQQMRQQQCLPLQQGAALRTPMQQPTLRVSSFRSSREQAQQELQLLLLCACGCRRMRAHSSQTHLSTPPTTASLVGHHALTAASTATYSATASPGRALRQFPVACTCSAAPISPTSLLQQQQHAAALELQLHCSREA
jgi:hypothetical protein